MRLLTLLIISLFLYPVVVAADIITVSSLKEIKPHFEAASEETLGIFDIDMVLLHPENPAFQIKNIKKHKPHLDNLLASLSPLEKDFLFNVAVKEGAMSLVEENTPSLIQEIAQKSVKLIALTGTLTGNIEKIEDFSGWRARQLKFFGMDFAQSFPDNKLTVFDNLPAYRNNHPQFKDGILFANGENKEYGKGKVLVEFLKANQYSPKTVVFVDDKEQNVQDVKNELQAFNPAIRYVGIIYQGAEQYPSQDIDETVFNTAWQDMLMKTKSIARLMK